MKKLIIAVCLVLALCIPALAADVGTCVETLEEASGVSNLKVLKVDCTAATGDIVRTLTNSTKLQGYILLQVDVQPVVAPTALSDLYLYNDMGAKVAGEDLINIVTTTSTVTVPVTAKPTLLGNWTLDVDNNIVAAARVIFRLYFLKL